MEKQPRKKILIVDDEKEMLEYLKKVLQRHGYDVVVSTKGIEAVPLAKAEKPDLIILDILLPDMMGGEIQQILAKDTLTGSIPIIFLSGLNTKEDEKILKEKAGTLYTLAKPTTAEEIVAAVKDVLDSTGCDAH